MNYKLFKSVSEVLSARLSLSLVTSFLLAGLALYQQNYISNRAEIVIERPMFSQDRELKYIRDEMTKNVALVWAFNAVSLYGNINPESIDLIEAVSYSFVDSDIAVELKAAHEEQLAYMREQSVLIRFVADGSVSYDDETQWVTITGTRIISPINPKSDIPDIRNRYVFKVKLSMTDFRPWISGWKEGLLDG